MRSWSLIDPGLAPRCSCLTSYLPGQHTRECRYVGRPEGAIHFAGEHTAKTNQGFLEGTVRSGERAAEQIVAAL